MGEWVPTAVVSNATNLLAVCSALFAFGFALGNLAARRGEHYHQQTRQQQQHEQQQKQQQGQQQGQQGVRRSCGSARGAKRKTRVRKSEENAKGKASRQVKPPPPSSSSGDLANDNADAAAATTKHLSRRTRNRMKKLASKDLALDAFTRVARSHVACIGSGDYEFLLLLPRKAFLAAGRFVPYADCRDRLVTLGEARRASTAGGGIDQLRVLYVSLSRANPGEGARDDWESKDWESKNFETARALLRRCPDLGFVYVGRSCVVAGGDSDGPVKRVEQLRHVPSVLLRADVVLVLPGQAGDDHADGNGDDSSPPGPRRRRHHRHSDFRFHAGGAWARMELALAAVGQAKVYVAFRAKPYPESLCELKPGKSDVGETTRQAAEALQVAATAGGGGGEAMTTAGRAEMIDPMSAATGMKRGEVEDNAAAAAVAAATAAAVVNAARENWVGTDLNPLATLEEARLAVTAAEKSDDADILESIKGMRPVPNPGFAESARASLGEERAEGSRELALSLLLFAVLCSQPKARATYTDAFVEDAGKLEISYRPIAVVRSPYRERFGTPRQPQVTASVLHGGAQEGQIVFLKGHGYEEALQDLSGFDMIWVISHMHLNKGWNRKVRPPRLPEERKGLFSTRSPHRPNALALSSLRVGRVDAAKGVIYVHGLDLLDGTPVLDIKPYIGYCDAFPDTKAGWLDALGSDHEEQRDFLPKFSVGATLVHTATRPENAPEGCAINAISGGKPPEESSGEALQMLHGERLPGFHGAVVNV